MQTATNTEMNNDSNSTTPPSFFSLLNDDDLVAALKKLNITEPTKVQESAIPVLIAKKDLVAEAQTGSGKTLAFVLPIISRIRSEQHKRGTFALILTPTRELALQVQKVIESIASDIKPALVIGGASQSAQIKALYNDCRIIVGTPGRIQDLINQRYILLRTCKAFVLDEADEMLSMGFLNEVRTILSRLPKERQGMLFSATISDRLQGLISEFLTNPETILVPKDEKTTAQIEHFFCTVEPGVVSKAHALVQLLTTQNVQSAIVFCNTKSDTEILENFLGKRNLNVRRINSDLSQRERDEVIASLRNKTLKYLLATDIAARGIDIKELEMVINYSIHDDIEVYVHRTGRTGRAGASGRAVSLISPLDFLAFHAVKKKLGITPTELVLPKAE